MLELRTTKGTGAERAVLDDAAADVPGGGQHRVLNAVRPPPDQRAAARLRGAGGGPSF